MLIMVQINPRVKEQLKILHKISYNLAKRAPAGVVDVPIGQLKPHDIARGLFVVSTSFAELTHKQDVIIKSLKEIMEDVRTLIKQAPDLEKEEIIKIITKIVLDDPDPDSKE